jgi:SAM-dependent methyltransferase
MNPGFYDQDYYERGLETGKSAYQNYRWIPELTIPLAMTIVDYLGINRGDSVLDFGCGKGYLVKALRLLYRDAWGVDCSSYALSTADANLARHLSPNIDTKRYFDFVIAKDVFEHIETEELSRILLNLRFGKMLVVVPLGDYGKYEALYNNLDPSHVICENKDWWFGFFYTLGFHVLSACYRVDGIKDSYYDQYPKAHGFFVLEEK